jgi:hypothetical protein
MGQRLDKFRAAAAPDPVAAVTFLLMAEKWIKLADEKAHSDARIQEQLGDFNRRQLFDN